MKNYHSNSRRKLYDSGRKIYDSGCSRNMFNSIDDFTSITHDMREEIKLANGSSIYSKGIGISPIYGESMYVPDLTRGLISTAQDDLAGRYTLFGNKKVIVTDKEPFIIGNVIRSGTLINSKEYLSDNIIAFRGVHYNDTDYIYPIPISSKTNPIASFANIGLSRWNYIHNVTAHTSLLRINDMIKHNTLEGLPKNPIRTPIQECKACILAKLKRKRAPTSKHRRPMGQIDPQKHYNPFEVVGCDIVELGSTQSLGGNKYCSVFIDFGTDLSSVYFHRTKDEFFEKCLKPYYYDVINPSSGRMGILHYLQTDDDSCFTDKIVYEWLGDKGCKSRISAPYHHTQNIRVEKLVHTLFDSATACMIESECPSFLKENALNYACDARNDNITNRHKSLSPTELYTGNKPTLKGKYPFYHPAYFVLENHKKFHPRSQQCYILRLQPGYKDAYLIYTPYSKSKLYVRFDVRASILNKFEDTTTLTRTPTTLPPLSIPTIIEENLEDIRNADINNDTNSPTLRSPIFISSQSGGSHDPFESDDSAAEQVVNLRGDKRRATRERKKMSLIDTQAKASEKRIAKIKQLTQDLGPYWVPEADIWSPVDDILEQRGLESRRRIHHKRSIPINKKYGQELSSIVGRRPTRKRRQAAQLALYESTDMPSTPSTLEEALNGPNAIEWKSAIELENIAIKTHNTYEPAPFYKGKTVKSKIAFRVTKEPDGTFKFKARLVAKGFTERKGYDYFHTFAPTVLTKSVHMILHLAATNNWEIRNLDVGSAYLEADIDTDLYMEIPNGFDNENSGVVRLRKSIYGLKQSGELWNNHIHKIFVSLGFKRSIDDPCMYARINGDERTYICLYVDDILVIGSHLSLILALENDLSKSVKKLKCLGNTIRYVGIDITRDRNLRRIYLSQEQFLSDVVSSESLQCASPKLNPAAITRNLYTATKGGNTPIRSLVGKLRYAVDNTRPDSLFATSQLSSAAADPGVQHLLASEHLVTYLNSSRHLKLTLGGTDPIFLECFADSSYIEIGDSKSQLAYCMRLGKTSGMFLSRSIKDNHVSLSSAESELYAVKEAIQDIVWSRNLLEFLGYPSNIPTPIYEDNQAVLFLTDTIKIHPRTKHLNKILNFVREFIQLNVISLIKIHTTLNIADIMTKNLDTKQFIFLRDQLLGV